VSEVSQTQAPQTQEPPIRRLLNEISTKIDRILEIEEKSRKVREVAKEVLGKECEVKVNYATGEAWCWERIDDKINTEVVEKIYQFLNATPPGPWTTRIAVKIATSQITQLDDEIIDYAAKERVSILFNEFYGIEYEDGYDIYVPIEQRDGVYAYLVICLERPEEDP